MHSEKIKIAVSDALGSVSAESIIPPAMKAMLILAHGAGAGMNHSFMMSLAHKLAELGIGTLRFNFLYMEKGKKMPDPSAIAEKTVGEVLAIGTTLFSQVPVVLGGKSFGGRMISQYIAKQKSSPAQALIFYGFPLHPANKPGMERAVHLSQVEIPMLFLQGTKDALAEVGLIKEVCSQLPRATLQHIEGADHSFMVGKRDCIAELAQTTETWLKFHKVC
jgi:predicted alpha/beta-hydrolase family hydrolase